MSRSRLISLVLTFVGLSVPANGANFGGVAPAIREFRRTGDNEIVVRFAGNSFQVLRGANENLDAEKGEALAKEAEALPSLRFSKTGEWIEYSVGQRLTVARPITSSGEADTTRPWKVHSLVPIGTFEVSSWRSFIGFALANGLAGVTEFKLRNESALTLLFAPVTPTSVLAGMRTLVFDHHFANAMRVSPLYPARSGKNGFVILLHDPHASVAGRFETLVGLRALISANPTVPFRFLVEGAYEDGDRSIGLAGMDRVITPGVPGGNAVVSQLLAQYVINAPTAYRLMHDRTIDTFAIDNNELLKYDAPRSPRLPWQQVDTLLRLIAAVKRADLLPELKSKLVNQLITAVVFTKASVGDDSSDATLVDHFTALSDLNHKLADLGRAVQKSGGDVTSADIDGLEQDALAYSDQAETYRKALDRNRTMTPFIIAAARTSSSAMPIAFIGSYHTRGIVAELQKASIGYVVIEPRPRIAPSELEQQSFDRANHLNTRRAYLSDLGFNMGMNLPRPPEVETFIKPKMKGTLARVESQLAATRTEFQALDVPSVNLDKLVDAANTNPALVSARIGFGGGTPPPPEFRTAFAFFEPGDGEGNSRLLLVDAKDRRWKDGDRYEFLKAALFRPPKRSGDLEIRQAIAFYPQPGSRRLFATVYEPESHRIYCFEGDPQAVALLVPIPIGDAKRGFDIRAQVAELLARIRRNDNG